MVTIIDEIRTTPVAPTPAPPSSPDSESSKLLRPVRITDVARLAGVSAATVSMVINNSPRITAATSARVRSAATRLGFRPNRLARALRGMGTRTLAAFIPMSDTGLANLYLGELLNGIRDAAHQLNYRILLERSGAGPADTPAIPHFDANEVEGLLCVGCTVADIPHDLLDLPLMLVDSRPARCQIDHVACDYTGAMTQSISYLRQLGHQHIALIHPTTPHHRSPELLQAYHQTLFAACSSHCAAVADADPTEQGGADSAAKLLDAHPDLTAIIAADDRMAIGALHQLSQRNLEVPRDISLITLGDLGPAAYTTPALTAMALPLRKIGALSCQRMIQRLKGEVSRVAELHPATLNIRASTALA